MYPILFHYGSFIVPAWHVLFLVAAATALFALQWIRKRYFPFIGHDDVLWLYLGAYAGGYFGARGLSVVIEQPEVLGWYNFLIALFSIGPLTFLGGFIGGSSMALLVIRLRRLPFPQLADLLLPALFLALAIGRIGCFLNGDDYGCALDLSPSQSAPWWAVKFPYHELPVYRYPVQLWESFAAICLFLFALVAYRTPLRQKQPGRIGITTLMLYCVVRFGIEFWRDDPRGTIGPFSTSQGISIAIVVGGVVGVGILKFVRIRRAKMQRA